MTYLPYLSECTCLWFMSESGFPSPDADFTDAEKSRELLLRHFEFLSRGAHFFSNGAVDLLLFPGAFAGAQSFFL